MTVVPALSVQGTIRLSDDVMVTFLIDLESGGYSQWGAPTEALGKTQPYVEAMAAGIIEAELISAEEEDEDEEVRTCKICDEEIDDSDMWAEEDRCSSCIHNAERSGA